jgi:hypothetical protein
LRIDGWLKAWTVVFGRNEILVGRLVSGVKESIATVPDLFIGFCPVGRVSA